MTSRIPSKKVVSFKTLCMGMALCLSVVAADFAAQVTPAMARPAPDSFADLAEKLTPSVVNISTSQDVSTRRMEDFPLPEVPPGSPFEDFFRDFFENRRNQGPQKVRSLGSGFVIRADGLVVTNNHVIEGADEVQVKFSDGRELEAEILGRDEKTDLAVLKVKADGPLPFVSFGDSKSLRVGDWVLAIGNPFGLGGTVTAGIVSSLNRNINAGPYDDFIQTDASINRGNSGGPLFNMDGQVVGINTAIFSPTGGSVGIGFSIPTDIAKNVIAQLEEFGETRRGWLGVRIQTVTQDIAESMGMKDAKGALVASIDDGGPAQKAGLKVGDVILKFNGRDVPEMRALPRIVADTKIGSRVPVQVSRKGQLKTFTVTVARLEEPENGEEIEQTQSDSPLTLGLSLSKMTQVLREQYDIPDDVEGVVITGVDFESDAAEKLRVGDVIVEVAQEPVSTPEDVVARVKQSTKASGRPILLLINRKGELTFRSIRPTSKEGAQ